MRRLVAAILVIFAYGLSGKCAAEVRSTADLDSAVSKCVALGHTDFSAIQDAPTQIIGAKIVAPGENGPEHCAVQGYVSPNVGFEMRLPTTQWNGRFIELGCGGACGTTQWLFWCPLERGYACIASDMGHKGKDQDGLWAYAYGNLQAQIDFGYRGVHVAALAGKAITEKYYDRAPTYSYFHGCSSGGRQALVEAERFPWDFNGIIGGGPWIDDTASATHYIWASRALRRSDGTLVLSRADLRMVHDAALARCDLDDGVKDGIISDPQHCRFDPSTLVCKVNQTSGCLTSEQAEAVNKVYDGPRTSTGEAILPRGSARGSEMNWVDDQATHKAAFYVHSDGTQSHEEEWALEYFRFRVSPPAGPSWKLEDFNFDRDYKRFSTGIQESLLNAGNPDMRRFDAAGGKMIIYQGWNDESVVPEKTIDFYELATRTMGGRHAIETFFRLFMIPGMGHCTGGDGAFAIDYLSAMEAWVERGDAPESLVGAHLRGTTGRENFLLKFPLSPTAAVDFTRPMYPYHLIAKYKGRGNPNAAQNYVPARPAP
jgi:hypothetical protein